MALNGVTSLSIRGQRRFPYLMPGHDRIEAAGQRLLQSSSASSPSSPPLVLSEMDTPEPCGAQIEYTKCPSTSTLLGRCFTELSCLLVVAYPMIHIYVFLLGDVEPYQRGFFCQDQSLMYPKVERDQVSNGVCFLIWALVVVSVVTTVEVVRHSVYKELDVLPPPWSRCSWPFLEIYRTLAYLVLGALFTLLATELTKFQVGRLRPYFLTVCRLPDEVCVSSYGFVTNYTCTGDAAEVREARKSFLSGHSSFSFYCATFLVIYLQNRLVSPTTRSSLAKTRRRWLKILLKTLRHVAPFVQFSIFLLAAFIALTRLSDYRHHPTDVLAGLALGTLIGMLVPLCLLDLARRPRIFLKTGMDRSSGRSHDASHMLSSRV